MESDADRIAFIFLDDGENEQERITFLTLYQRARVIAELLQAGCRKGERALLLFPPGLEYIQAFWACQFAGIIAVPAYPPRNNRNLPRLAAIIKDSQAVIALTTAALLPRIEAMFATLPELAAVRLLATDAERPSISGTWQGPEIRGDDLSFLQYTSGSTGTPKGVMLSHGNLLHNLELIRMGFRADSESCAVIWLPPYHDMGLIGGILGPIYNSVPCVLMPPAAFLQRPVRILEAITRYHGTICGGPNFTYELCWEKVPDEVIPTLDLSTWRTAFNGAEPVRAETLHRFATKFAPAGFKPEAFYPCYGLAESTVFVSIRMPGEEIELQADKPSLARNLVKAPGSPETSQTLVASGSFFGDQKVRIVDPESLQPCPEGVVGEIWVSGASVAQGYWGKEAESDQMFRARLADGSDDAYLRTEDYGFMVNGSLFITGRIKDLIIIRGINHYPQDIEATAERSHPALRRGCGAAFSIDAGEEERLVVVHELEFRAKASAEEVAQAMRQLIAEEHDLQLHALMLVKPGTIPKTSSGKIRRRSCRAGFLEGTLESTGEWRADLTEGRGAAPGDEALPPLSASGENSPEDIIRWLTARLAVELHLPATAIDPHRPFAAYGLDSVQAMSLAGDLAGSLGRELAPTLLYDYPTIADVAQHLAGSGGGESRRAPLVRQPRDREHYPLSYGQRRLWFLTQLDPESPLYNNAAVLEINGHLDVSAWSASLQQIIDRHEILRTGFGSLHGEPFQSVQPSLNFRLEETDLRGSAASDHAARLQQLVASQIMQPFDLQQPPLLRSLLVRLEETRYHFIVTLHHIISDGWSLGVFAAELANLYRTAAAGTSARRPELAFQYIDYVGWQQEWFAGAVREEQLTYWRRQLAGADRLLDLPTDRPRPKVQTTRGGVHQFALPQELLQQLEEVSRQEQATLFMTLLAAFNLLLYRYTGQQDICVGTPVANRNRHEFEALIGFFVNTLVLRTRITSAGGFRELLGAVRDTALAAFAHQDTPFETLVEELQPGRDPSRTPFFQVMFVMQNTPRPDAAADGVQMVPRLLYTPTAKFDLTLEVEKSGELLEGRVVYNSDLFDPATIERFADHYERLLGAICHDLSQPLGRMPLLTEPEEQRLLQTLAGDAGEAEEAEPACVHQLFRQRVGQTPLQELECDGSILTYAEFEQRADRLAAYLRRQGVGPEVAVGLFLERSLDALAGMLAIFKAGGVFLPLDPDYPAERIAFMIEDSGAPFIISRQALAERLPVTAARIIAIDADREAIAGADAAVPAAALTPANSAYIIYTSGSTGRPKGVVVPHQAFAGHCERMRRYYEMTADDVVMQFASLNFDASLEQIFTALLAGARLVMRGSEIWTFTEFERLVTEKRLSVINLPPGYWQTITMEAARATELPRAERLRLVIIGGDALSPETLSRWWTTPWGQARLLNAYGPTETTITATTFAIPREWSGKRVPIGKALARRTALIIDRHGNLTPAGLPGELCLAGAGLAYGYLNAADLTSEKFAPNPFATAPGERLYHTGDLVRLLPDGQIDFLGRIDHQVKIRGFRIELDEISALLETHSRVAQAAVAAIRSKEGDTRLASYVVLKNSETPANMEQELIVYLKSRLPAYMVPSFMLFLPQLPTTPIGKLDRKALPLPDLADEAAGKSYVEPRTPVEAQLAQLFAELLQVGKVGIHDSFFDLGGHSLLATQLVSRIHDTFQIQLPLRALFETPAIADLAITIAQRQAEQLGGADFDALMAEVDQLSEDEIAQLLAKEMKN